MPALENIKDKKNKQGWAKDWNTLQKSLKHVKDNLIIRQQ